MPHFADCWFYYQSKIGIDSSTVDCVARKADRRAYRYYQHALPAGASHPRHMGAAHRRLLPSQPPTRLVIAPMTGMPVLLNWTLACPRVSVPILRPMWTWHSFSTPMVLSAHRVPADTPSSTATRGSTASNNAHTFHRRGSMGRHLHCCLPSPPLLCHCRADSQLGGNLARPNFMVLFTQLGSVHSAKFPTFASTLTMLASIILSLPAVWRPPFQFVHVSAAGSSAFVWRTLCR